MSSESKTLAKKAKKPNLNKFCKKQIFLFRKSPKMSETSKPEPRFEAKLHQRTQTQNGLAFLCNKKQKPKFNSVLQCFATQTNLINKSKLVKNLYKKAHV